jgi:hypothetical protein
MNAKVTLNAADIGVLLQRAKENGTLDAWASVAMQWIEQADAHIDCFEEAKTNAGEAAIDGFLFGRDRKTPVVHELVAGLDDGPTWAPEDLYDKPLCRMVYAVDRGDPSVGIPSRASFVLAEDQTGTLFPELMDAWNIRNRP